MSVLRRCPASNRASSFRHRFEPVSLAALCRAVLLGAFLLPGLGCFRSDRPADLVIINGAEPESLDPHLVTGQADGRLVMALFEGLTRFEPVNAQSTPGLAERWEIDPGGGRYTFFIRTNAAWSTGDPIQAEDFRWSWQRILSPETASEYAGVLYYLKNGEAYATGRLKDFDQVGVHARSPHILDVELEAPTAFFLDLCSFQPYAVVPRRLIERFGDRWLNVRPFMASGAYTLDFWRLNDRVRLRRNPHYWDAANTQSETVDMLSCVVPATALNLYLSGAADVVWDKELVPPDLLDRLLPRPDFHTFPSLGNYFIRINVTRKPFSDPRVRHALALAIDKPRIVQRITKGGEKVAGCVSPPGIANGTNIYQPPIGLGYDPAAARRLLAEAGFPGGTNFPTLQYTYNTQESHRKIGVELREMWGRELGLRVEFRQLEWKSWLRAQSMLDYDLIRSSWVGDYNDPNTFLDLFMSDNPNNRTGWRNAAYDDTLRRANAETDPRRRQTLLREAESILVERDLPVIPLFFYVGMEFYDTNHIAGIFSNVRSEHPLRVIHRLPRP
jgi:oligopeptide transport system substrate-binding protein